MFSLTVHKLKYKGIWSPEGAKTFFQAFLFLMLCQSYVFCQIKIETSNNQELTPQRLVEDVFLGNGVKILKVTSIGSNQSIGYFNGAMGDIGLQEGIVLSTGTVDHIDRANDSPSTGDTPEIGNVQFDQDLQNLSSYPIKEVTGIEIEFVSQTELLEFKYVFASEEYPEFNCSKFNDIFAFFISGPDPNGGLYNKKNIALVPDPMDPTGNTFTDFPVWTNSVNNGLVGTDTNGESCNKENETLSFSQYYNDNSGSTTFTLDGYLDVFKARASVVPCQVYTIKLIIGDNNDFDYDSAVFLEANSLTSKNYHYYVNADLEGSLTEGCNSGIIGVKFDQPVTVRTELPIQTLNSLPDDASIGQDYQLSSDKFVLLPGQTTAEIQISVLEDGIVEGLEYLRIIENNNECIIDTFSVLLKDNELIEYFSVLDDALICSGQSLLDANLPALENQMIIEESAFRITNFGAAGSESVSVSLPIDADQLTTWQNGVIHEICIEGFTHADASEVSLLLVSPSGHSVRLIQPGDLSGNYFSEELCFDQSSTLTNIQTLFREGELLIGMWQLILVDSEFNSVRGSIDRWSINFNNPRFLDYTIKNLQNEMIDPSAPVTENLTIIIEAVNAAGCVYLDTASIFVIDDILAPTDLICKEIDRDRLSFSWVHTDPNMVFEVNYGSGWQKIGNVRSFEVGDLKPSETILFQVRAIATGCSSAEEEIICGTPACIAPIILEVSRSNPDNTCIPNGFIEVRTVNTKGPYKYFVNDEPNESSRFINLGQGTYKIDVVDGYGCMGSLSVILNGAQELSLDFNKEDALCGQQGYIDLFVEGGRAPYSYSWSTGSRDRDVNGLDAGTYRVTVSDNAGCVLIDSIEIIASAALLIDQLIVTNVSCRNANDGAININLSGGSGPFDIVVKNSNGLIVDRSQGLAADDYIVEITDQVGCKKIRSFSISQPIGMTLDVNTTIASCSYITNGSAEVSVQGGSAPYQYSWSSGGNGPSEENLSSGNYTVTVSDSNGCEVSIDAFVPAAAEPNLTINKGDNLCFGESSGFIEIDISNMGFSVLWGDGSVATRRNQLLSGTYCAIITSEFGCVIDTCIMVTQPEQLNISVQKTNNVCFGSVDGRVTITPSNGVGPYSVSYKGNTLSGLPTFSFDELAIGMHEFTIIDAAGCTRVIESEIFSAPEVIIDFSVEDVSCAYGSDGSIEAFINGLSGPSVLQWSGPDGFESNRFRLENLNAGSYIVNITGSNQCQFARSVEVGQPDNPVEAIVNKKDITCFSDNNGSIQISATGGDGVYSYSLNDNTSYSNVSIFDQLEPGDYKVFVKDQSDCELVLDSISIVEPLEFAIDLDADTEVYEYQDVPLRIDVNNAQGRYDLFWTSDPLYLLPCQSCDSTVIENIEHTIFIAVEAIDDNGCSAYTEKKIYIKRGNHIAIPTGFSPNGDGNNDLLYIYGTPDAIVREFMIFNRSGEKLYEDGQLTTNMEERGWDGTYKGLLMTTGSYIWTALAEFPDGKILKFSGAVQLIR